ncbi:nucleoside/nucleotide kinase family protein [Jingyaoa shaoxingensis]|uniref:Guanylate kinase n=1 Tax=Jingyaoa shaoxingensis TaxID=2763671 RepID=A0ABR7N8Q7_9FIRM|nr:guanylate kinase [Jingyaoa shaoxingensis]MBC8572784.1 guanylate kinase [Jingyaoa shaoxingensis]
MARLFYMIGKSSTGKDTIYREVISRTDLDLNPLVMYTTRPIRKGETDGKEYYFVDENVLNELEKEGRVIEKRAYHTIHGIWTYFTVDDEHADLNRKDYLAIGTLESYAQIRNYYGEKLVVPVYIQVEDGLRLERALKREKQQPVPKYEELCRRFLADQADYAEEKLAKAGIDRRFSNDKDIMSCVEEVAAFIRAGQKK